MLNVTKIFYKKSKKICIKNVKKTLHAPINRV